MVTFYKIALLTLLSISWPLYSNAATTFFSPQSLTSGVGKTFTLSVNVESSQQAMNAASGVISFPKDKLEVVSVSKSGSIFSLWVQEPSFSNSSGTITFEGIVLNPGFTGSSAKVLSVTFRAKQEGGANIKFSSGSILANDGTGINILTNPGAATINITAKQVELPQAVASPLRKDVVPPEPFQILFPEGSKTSNTRPEISFGTIDKDSGVSHYLVQIDQQKEERLESSSASNTYILPEQLIADHTVTVTAVDKAGNSQESIASFTVYGPENNTVTTPEVVTTSSFRDSFEQLLNKINAFVLQHHIIIIIALIILQLIALLRLVFLAKRNKSTPINNELTLKTSLDALEHDIQQHLNRLSIARKDRTLSPEEMLFMEHFANKKSGEEEVSDTSKN